MNDNERKQYKNEPTVAPGLRDEEELDRRASSGEIRREDSTKVTRASYDEVDASE